LGLSVSELAERLGLSYMGVKQHCEELERQGMVDTRRRPKPMGRPEVVYRLTAKARIHFPSTSNGTTVEILLAANRLYGPAAAEKLLYSLFSSKTEEYRRRLRGDTAIERAELIARFREKEGFLSEFHSEPVPAIVDFHNPIGDLLEAFPLIRRLEKEMMERLLGVGVERAEATAGDLYQCRFVLGI
jgi:predicted ArsR family transcriptional regulator